MQVPKVYTHEKPTITIIRSDKYDKVLKDIHCVVCGAILFQSYSSTHAITPGIKDRRVYDKSMMVLECKNKKTFRGADGQEHTTRCNTRYLIT